MDKSGKPNGFKIRSSVDLVAIATLVSLCLSLVAWGLKLEARNDALAIRVAALEARVSNGILPRAEERIEYLVRENEDLKRRVERLEDRD